MFVIKASLFGFGRRMQFFCCYVSVDRSIDNTLHMSVLAVQDVGVS